MLTKQHQDTFNPNEQVEAYYQQQWRKAVVLKQVEKNQLGHTRYLIKIDGYPEPERWAEPCIRKLD
jgi:hypothetical protein